MALFRKKADPLSERSKALNLQIEQLEAEIKRLDGRLQQNRPHPKLRSTAVPHGETVTYPTPGAEESTAPVRPAATPQEPIFEEVDQEVLAEPGEAAVTPEHYNELGVRKYDLPALLKRIRRHFRGPSTTNPKLVSYLAAGGIQGLRPLRYEKRVARNRFILLVVGLFFVLLGLIWVFVKNGR